MTAAIPTRTKVIINKVPLALDKTAKDMILTFVTKVLGINSDDIDPMVQTDFGEDRRIVIQTAVIPNPDQTLRELCKFAKKLTEYMAMLDQDLDFYVQEAGAQSNGEQLVCKHMTGGTFWPHRQRMQCSLGDIMPKSNRPRRLTAAERAAGSALFPQPKNEWPICADTINILSSTQVSTMSDVEATEVAQILANAKH